MLKHSTPLVGKSNAAFCLQLDQLVAAEKLNADSLFGSDSTFYQLNVSCISQPSAGFVEGQDDGY